MRPKIFHNCKLYTFDRDTLTFGTIEPDCVGVKFEEGEAIYYPLDTTKNLIIVQALNMKKASARMLTIIIKQRENEQ